MFVGIEVPVGSPKPFASDPQGAESHLGAVVVDAGPKSPFFVALIFTDVLPESCPLDFTTWVVVYL